jgi:hypothetical protein
VARRSRSPASKRCPMRRCASSARRPASSSAPPGWCWGHAPGAALLSWRPYLDVHGSVGGG